VPEIDIKKGKLESERWSDFFSPKKDKDPTIAKSIQKEE